MLGVLTLKSQDEIMTIQLYYGYNYKKEEAHCAPYAHQMYVELPTIRATSLYHQLYRIVSCFSLLPHITYIYAYAAIKLYLCVWCSSFPLQHTYMTSSFDRVDYILLPVSLNIKINRRVIDIMSYFSRNFLLTQSVVNCSNVHCKMSLFTYASFSLPKFSCHLMANLHQ